MGINWNISVGDIVLVLTMMGGVAAMFFGVKSDVRMVKHDLHSLNDKVSMMGEAWIRMGDVLTKVAVQDERLNRVEEDMRELRHGNGFVLSKPLTQG